MIPDLFPRETDWNSTADAGWIAGMKNSVSLPKFSPNSMTRVMTTGNGDSHDR